MEVETPYQPRGKPDGKYADAFGFLRRCDYKDGPETSGKIVSEYRDGKDPGCTQK